MKILGIIPSRYASTRFPGKPLVNIMGKSMIQRVYDQAKKSEVLTELIVATDHKDIQSEVESFGGQVMLTRTDHQNGTERCGEVLERLDRQYDYIINIQGDEPFIDPIQINQLGSLLDGTVQIATLIKKIDRLIQLDDPLEMKVVINGNHEAIYFSRTCIPYLRDIAPEHRLNHHDFYKHIGLYAFRSDTLPELVKLPVSPLEKAESLEQLRWMECGYKINIGITKIESQMIDTPDELEEVLKSMNL